MAGKTSLKSTKVEKKDGAEPVLLSGGNPQIAKADGDAPMQAYIAAMPGWKSDVGRRLDDLIVRNVPDVRKAVRWNSPWYGVEGEGWFVSYHVFTRYVKVTFLNGASLRPVPPGSGKDPDSRWIDIYEGELDETQMATWVRQARAFPKSVRGEPVEPQLGPSTSSGRTARYDPISTMERPCGRRQPWPAGVGSDNL